MRNIALFTAVLIITAFLFGLVGCTKPKPANETVLVIDQTEENFTQIMLPEAKSISAIPDTGAKVDSRAGEITRIVPISEILLTSAKQVEIKPVGNVLLSNEPQRKREITEYWSKIDSALSEADDGKRDREGSAIYATLHRELSRLAESDSPNRQIIISSDGLEHSALANFYLPETLKQIPDGTLQKLYEEKYPLPNLSGISIVWLYTAPTMAESERFATVSSFYSKLFTDHGATFEVSANLNGGLAWKR